MSNDGYFQYLPGVTVLDPAGTQYVFGNIQMGDLDPNLGTNVWEMASSIIDRNGNEVLLNAGGNGYTDALGRSVVSWTGLGNDGDQVSVAGLTQPFVMHWGTARARPTPSPTLTALVTR